jgi:5-dehydro-2-deoxygluconokinase
VTDITPDPATADELITMGRVGVDLYPLQTGRSLADVDQFGKYLGGSPTNVAVAAARYGRRAAVITRTGDDPFGRFIHQALRGFGVDDRYVTAVPGLPTPVTFCEIFPPDDFPLYFYRYPKAPDLEIHPGELDLAAISAAGIFWATVTGLCAEPSRSATLAALRARDLRHPTVLDLDFRPMFWTSPGEASRWAKEALGLVTVAVGNLDECEMAVGTRDPDQAADALLGLGAELAVIKQGPAGVLARSRQDEVQVPPVRVPVVNGLGAGDAFGGALCHGLLGRGLPDRGSPGQDPPRGDAQPPWDLATAVRFANAAGALVASRIACADAMPTAAEVAALLEEAPGA